MKVLIPLLFSISLYGQAEWKGYIMLFGAGMSDALTQTLAMDYDRFKDAFPQAKDQFWNPQESRLNRYKDRDPSKGPAFPFSTNLLAFTTSGYQLSRTTTRSLFLGGAIRLTIGKKYTNEELLKAGIFGSLSYSAGYFVTNTIIFNE